MKKSPKMNAKRRESLKKSQFGLPKERKYPVDTRGRASNAKARATQQYEKGNLSKSEKDRIDEKANEVLYGTKKPKMKYENIKRGTPKKKYKNTSDMRKDYKRKGIY